MKITIVPARKYRRAPNGYRVQEWADGTFHVYDSKGGCIDECVTRKEAVELALKHKYAAKLISVQDALAGNLPRPDAEGGR